MEECEEDLAGDILRSCNDNNVGGIETDVLLFNKKDIDETQTTFDATNGMIVTNFKLKAGKTGYLFQGVKQVNSVRSELVVKETSENKWKHAFLGNIPNSSAVNKKRLSEIDKSDIVAMVQTKFKGTDNKDAFQLFGYHVGMNLGESVYASNENDGAITINVASLDGYEEPKPPYTVLNTDYETTLTNFNNKFATAPVTP